MNIVHIRELAKKLGQPDGVLSQKSVHEFLHCPVFVFERTHPLSNDEIEWLTKNVADDNGILPKRLPFEWFIIQRKWYDEDLGRLNPEEERGEYTLFIHRKKDLSGSLWVVMCYTYKKDSVWIRMEMTGEIKNGIKSHFWLNEKPISIGETPIGEDKELMDDMMNMPVRILFWFCFDVFSHVNTILRVSPHKNGKSVEWTLARTHYLILNRKQAQACQFQKRGPTQQEIHRAAHWRIAHLRRLMSKKFTHKQGQIVFVKQAWVGPTDWIGLDDKIYKVIDI